ALPTEPVVIAQLSNPAGFRALVDNEVQKLSANTKAPQIQWVEDPRQAVVSATTDKQLYAWINGDMLVASPKLAGLQTIANGGSFSTASFYSRIADVYRDGAGIILAADLEKIIAHTRGLRRLAVGDSHEQALNQ